MKNNWKIAIAWIATVLVVFIISNLASRNREVGGEVYNARAMEDTVRFTRTSTTVRWLRSYPCYRFPARC